jgi:hypothetical protein
MSLILDRFSVEFLQSGARDLLLLVFNKKQQMLRYAQHDSCPFQQGASLANKVS